MQYVDEFQSLVNTILGLYFDAIRGFGLVYKWFVDTQQNSLRVLRDGHPRLASIEYLDSVSFSYGKGDPTESNSIELVRHTQGEVKARNAKGGANERFIGNMCLVTIYQYWEDYYRNKIAESLGISKNELSFSIMGDLRLIRHSIIHHRAVALPDVGECALLSWFKEGDEIAVSQGQVEELIFHIRAMCDQLRSQADANCQSPMQG